MILDHLNNAFNYTKLNPGFGQAFAWLDETDQETIDPGRHTIMGDDVFALVSEYTTKQETECRPESHRIYTDIQVMVKGKERIGWEPLGNQVVSTQYNEEADILFYESHPAGFELTPGYFAVFFPTDIHMPCIETDGAQMVRKIVIKVKTT